MKKYLIASLFGLIMCMAYTQKSQAATQAYGTNLTLAIGGAPASFNFTSPANDSFQKSAGTIFHVFNTFYYIGGVYLVFTVVVDGDYTLNIATTTYGSLLTQELHSGSNSVQVFVPMSSSSNGQIYITIN